MTINTTRNIRWQGSELLLPFTLILSKREECVRTYGSIRMLQYVHITHGYVLYRLDPPNPEFSFSAQLHFIRWLFVASDSVRILFTSLFPHLYLCRLHIHFHHSLSHSSTKFIIAYKLWSYVERFSDSVSNISTPATARFPKCRIWGVRFYCSRFCSKTNDFRFA